MYFCMTGVLKIAPPLAYCTKYVVVVIHVLKFVRMHDNYLLMMASCEFPFTGSSFTLCMNIINLFAVNISMCTSVSMYRCVTLSVCRSMLSKMSMISDKVVWSFAHSHSLNQSLKVHNTLQGATSMEQYCKSKYQNRNIQNSICKALKQCFKVGIIWWSDIW